MGLLTRLRQDRRSCGGADFFKCQTINMRKEHELSEARRDKENDNSITQLHAATLKMACNSALVLRV